MWKKIVLAACISMVLFACTQEKKETKAQETAIHYLFLPALISDTFSRVMWHHDIDFRGFDRGQGLLYFIAKKNLSKAEMLKLLTLDTSKIEYAPCDSGICEFGGMRGKIDGYYAFRIPSTNLRVDSSRVLHYSYFDTTIAVPFTELMQEMDSNIFYNWAKTVDLSTFFGKPMYASNMGAYVSRRGKDLLIKKLCDKITQGLKTQEEKAQALLHFVTKNISYSYEDLWYESEIVKRAHEVLLSGDGDCSAKTTLYASLLEQCDIPYCLLYYKNHINVGVVGNFANENGYFQTVEGKKYAVAETTVENFIIGKSKIENDEIISKLLFYQMPYVSSNIYDAQLKTVYPLVDMGEE